MLHTDDDLSIKLSMDDASALIAELRKLATGKSDLDDFHRWRTLMLAAAELERCYVRTGTIPDPRRIKYRI